MRSVWGDLTKDGVLCQPWSPSFPRPRPMRATLSKNVQRIRWSGRISRYFLCVISSQATNLGREPRL